MGRSRDTTTGGRYSVVYLDPDAAARAHVSDVLEADTAFDVRAISTARDLRRHLESDEVDTDCVVSEYDLVDTDGIALCQWLSAEHPTVPFLLYTDGDERLASEAVASGASQYVPKATGDGASVDLLVDRLRSVAAETRPTATDQTHWDHLEAMHDVALSFESCSSTEEAYQLAVETVDSLLGGEASVLYVERESPAITRVSDDFVAVATVGTSEAASFFERSVSQSIAEQATRSGGPYTADPQSFGVDGPIRSVACVPVSTVGILQTVATRPEAFGDHELKLVELLGAHLSTTISRIRSERALRSERNRFASFFESVPDPVAFTNPMGTGSIIDVNPAFEETFGYDREELLGQSLAKLVVPETETRIDVYDEVGADDVITREVTRLTAAGPREFLFRGFAIDVDGEIHQYVIYTDITERKRREQRIRTLHDGSRKLMVAEDAREVADIAVEIATEAFDLPIVGIHIYDADLDALRPMAISNEAWKLFDEPPVIEPDDGLAWTAFERQEPMVYGTVQPRRTDSLQNPETAIRSEVYLPIGTHGVLLAGSTNPDDVTDEELTLGKILAANVETALDRAEREAELERQNDRLEAFASTVSHDLRNPLAVAKGHLDLAATCDLEAGELSTHLEEIGWGLSRMEELIDDVLLLARSGQRVTETESVALEDVVEEASRGVGSELTVTIEGSLPTVEADANRLLVLFENLFRNSVEHGQPSESDGSELGCEQGGAETDLDADAGVGSDGGADAGSGSDGGPDTETKTPLTVTIAPIDGGIFVADNGPGIPAGEHESIFESGYTTDPEGTGFGLAIVSEVVEAHGWTIEATENGPTGGARFEIRFD